MKFAIVRKHQSFVAKQQKVASSGVVRLKTAAARFKVDGWLENVHLFQGCVSDAFIANRGEAFINCKQREQSNAFAMIVVIKRRGFVGFKARTHS